MNEEPTEEELEGLSEGSSKLPVEKRDSFPTPDEQLTGGYLLKFIGTIRGKWDLFEKTVCGQVVSILLIIHGVVGLGATLFNGTKVIYNFSEDAYASIQTYLETHDTSRETADGYLVKIPQEYQQIEPEILTTEFPPNTGFAPIPKQMSGYDILSGGIA